MLDAGLGEGNLYIDVDHGDSDFDTPYLGELYSTRTRPPPVRYDRYTIELDVQASAWALDAIEASHTNRGLASTRGPEIYKPEVVKIDYLPSLELFINVTKVLVIAWANDQTRFSFLELK